MDISRRRRPVNENEGKDGRVDWRAFISNTESCVAIGHLAENAESYIMISLASPNQGCGP